MPFVVPLLIACLLSALGCAALVYLAPRLGFVDSPDPQSYKRQRRSVPYGGGLAMGIALLAALWLAYATAEMGMEPAILVILLAAAALLLLGLVDDCYALSPRLKLIFQSVIIIFAVAGADLSLDIIHELNWLSVFLAFWWCLILTNAYNLMDHADGMSASIALVSISVLLATALLNMDMQMAMLWLVMIGCLGGFLFWNLPPAKIYMGDAGSLPLGFLIAAGSIHMTFWFSDGSQDTQALSVFTPVLIAMLPIYDMLVVMTKRYRLKRPLMGGDRNHLSHRMSRLGLSPRSSLATAVALQLALAAGALLLRHKDAMTGIIVLAQAACLCLIALLLEANRDRTV